MPAPGTKIMTPLIWQPDLLTMTISNYFFGTYFTPISSF